MSCLLVLFSSCILYSQDIYMTGEMQLVKPRIAEFEGEWCYNHWCRGPRATLRVGATWTLPAGWTVDTGYAHTSYAAESDRGVEYPYISLTWRPFQ